MAETVIESIFLVIGLILTLPFAVVFFLFLFPPTRNLFARFIKRKLEKMGGSNPHVFYRSYTFANGEFKKAQADMNSEIRDVKPLPLEEIQEPHFDKNI